jgi:hypothetical protein
VGGALGLVIACVTTTGEAADGWQKPISLGRLAPDLHLTSLSVGVRGDAAAAWYSKQTKPPYAYRVRVATSKRGHGWVGPTTFYAGNHRDIDGPHVVVNSDGLATVLWAEGANSTDVTHCRVRIASGKVSAAWSPSWIFSTECAVSTQLTVDGHGDLVAAWQSLDTDRPTYATKVHGHAWSSPALVPHSQGLAVRGLATNQAGDSTMVLAGDDPDHHGVYVVRRHRGTGWSNPVRVSRVEPLGVPQVAESAKGNATLMWSGARHRIFTASSSVHGRWSKARRLGRGYPSRIEYDQRRVLAVWASLRGSTLFAMKRPRAGWQAAENLSGTSKRNQEQDVSVDGRGRVTVVWSNFYTGNIHARTRGKSGRWSEIQTVTAKGYATTPFVASSPGERTWVVWRVKNDDQRFRAKASARG